MMANDLIKNVSEWRSKGFSARPRTVAQYRKLKFIKIHSKGQMVKQQFLIYLDDGAPS